MHFSIFCTFSAEKEFLQRKFDKYCDGLKEIKFEGFSLLMKELGVTAGLKDLFR